MLTIERCRELLGKRETKKLANNTYLRRLDASEGESYAVRLHETDVVRIEPTRGGATFYTLRTGGWATSTTKDRINAYGPVHIYSEKKVWRLTKNERFVDGGTYDQDGKLVC